MYTSYIQTGKWKGMLKKVLSFSRKNGLAESCIEGTAKALTCAATNIMVPDTEGEKVFFDLWQNASSEERVVLVRLILRIIEQ